MEDEFTEMESEDSGYVSGRTQGLEIGPINFIELVRGDYLTVPQRGDVRLRVFPPQYDSESGTYRSGRVTSTVFRDDWDAPFTTTLPLELTMDAADEIGELLEIGYDPEGGSEAREQFRYDVEVTAVERGFPLPLDLFQVRGFFLLTSTDQRMTADSYLRSMAERMPLPNFGLMNPAGI
jgi:hypothetical protein